MYCSLTTTQELYPMPLLLGGCSEGACLCARGRERTSPQRYCHQENSDTVHTADCCAASVTTQAPLPNGTERKSSTACYHLDKTSIWSHPGFAQITPWAGQRLASGTNTGMEVVGGSCERGESAASWEQHFIPPKTKNLNSNGQASPIISATGARGPDVTPCPSSRLKGFGSFFSEKAHLLL